MEREPVSYKDFMTQYQDRILFGSDAVIGQPEKIQSSFEFIHRFLEDREVFHKLVNKNYKSYMNLPENKS